MDRDIYQQNWLLFGGSRYLHSEIDIIAHLSYPLEGIFCLPLSYQFQLVLHFK